MTKVSHEQVLVRVAKSICEASERPRWRRQYEDNKTELSFEEWVEERWDHYLHEAEAAVMTYSAILQEQEDTGPAA